MTFLSPLRYPGGKGLLLRFVREIVLRNGLQGSTYVEPFAGGAAVALGLLRSGDVEHAIIGDADPAIAAFWRAALQHPDELRDLIEGCEVTIDTWHEQAYALKQADSSESITLGFAAFFLNRTNRSGILRARPIGGLNQDGPYKLDCRFNKTNLIQRLNQVARLADRITVHGGDAVDLLAHLAPHNSHTTFVYADPPYLTKSTDLYLDTMTFSGHQQLSSLLVATYGKWIVSYDCDPRIARDLYPDCEILQFDLRHSAARSHRGKEVMVFSPLIDPDAAAHLLHNPIWLRRDPIPVPPMATGTRSKDL